MTLSIKPRSKVSDTDVAYELLAIQGSSMYYNDLINGVLNQQNRPTDPLNIADVLTQINLDTRFYHEGNGVWGLKNWAAPPPVKKTSSISLISKKTATGRLAEEETDILGDSEDGLEADLELEIEEDGDDDSEEDSDSVFVKQDGYDSLDERPIRSSWR